MRLLLILLIISLGSASNPVDKAERQGKITEVTKDVKYNFKVSPSNPVYYEIELPRDVDAALVKIKSDDWVSLFKLTLHFENKSPIFQFQLWPLEYIITL